MFRSGKKYGHEVGLSCCFRQHRAHSHCNLLHGYALAFEFEFEAEDGDRSPEGWVVDFGGLKSLKGLLEDNFDHKLLVAEDDPELDYIASLSGMGIADVRVLPAVGCEAFAEMGFQLAKLWLWDNGFHKVTVVQCTVREHGANWASYSEAEQGAPLL